MDKRIVKYFERNKGAKAAHLVLMEVFGDMASAQKHARGRNGVVTSFTRKEYDVWAAKNKSEKPADENKEVPTP